MSRRKRRNTQFDQSAGRNTFTYVMWENYLKNIALTLFKWEGLPDTCDERFLELTLYNRGYALFFQDPILATYLAMTCTIQGEWDVYNIPIQREAFASNDYHCARNKSNSVIIFNNWLHLPGWQLTRNYAERIANIERTIDVNVSAQRTPIAIKARDEVRLTMKNFYMQYDGNSPFIFTDESFPFENLEVINTEAPFVAPGLFQLKQFYINEYLTLLGIENSNQDKKAQMTANEIGSNYGQVEVGRYNGLTARQQAANEINRMFGLNISVHPRSQISTMLNRPFMGIMGDDIEEPSDDVPMEDIEE